MLLLERGHYDPNNQTDRYGQFLWFKAIFNQSKALCIFKGCLSEKKCVGYQENALFTQVCTRSKKKSLIRPTAVMSMSCHA